jgi:hypothetical protein
VRVGLAVTWGLAVTVAASGLSGVLLAVALEPGGLCVAAGATVAARLGLAVLLALALTWGFVAPPGMTVAVLALTGVLEFATPALAEELEVPVAADDARGAPLGEAELTASAPAQKAAASRKMGRANLPSFARQPARNIVTPSEAA